MIEQDLAELADQDNEAILEIGFGNGAHVSNILDRGDHISYNGIDISELIIEKTRKLNSQWINAGRAHFFKNSDGKTIPFEDGQFDGIFFCSHYLLLNLVQYDKLIRLLSYDLHRKIVF